MTPFADAVIAVVPTSSALMSPLLETDAAVALVDAHVNVIPCRTWPDASFATACACIVESRPIDDDGAVTVMDAIAGFTTVSASAFEVTDPTVAVIVTAPVATPVTSPFASTVATAELLDVQVKLWPLSTLPLASFATAVACNV